MSKPDWFYANRGAADHEVNTSNKHPSIVGKIQHIALALKAIYA
ncbi:hypothetical protein REH76_04730 [Photobacterium damselae]